MNAPRARFVARELGPATIGVLVVGEGVLWTVARPAGDSTASFVGQLLGAESILLLSIGLVLISMLPWVEHWFDACGASRNTMGTTASRVAPGAVACIGGLLAATHVITRARTGEQHDLLLAQTVLGAVMLIATAAVGVVLIDAIPATAVAVAATLAVAISAAVILGRLGMAAPWLSAVYRFVSDPKAMLESAGRRRS
jgi:hypothetical protein